MWLVGQKYEFAVKWNINVVSPRWLNDSVKLGHSLSESNYQVTASSSKTTHTTSTPTNDNGLYVCLSVCLILTNVVLFCVFLCYLLLKSSMKFCVFKLIFSNVTAMPTTHINEL